MSDVPVDERLDGEQAAEIPMDVAPIKTEGGERAERGPVTPPEPAEPAAASTNELPADEPIDADPTETNGEAPANGDAPMEATTLVRPKMEAVDEAMDTSEHAPKEPPVAAASEGELSSGEEEGEAADAKTTERRSKKKKRKSRKRSPSPAEANGDRKRKHSDVGGGDEKKKLEKLKEMKFGDARTGEQDTRRFNFRPTDAKKTAGESPASKPTSSKAAKGAKASGRGPRTPEPSPFVSDENAHPVLKAFRQLKSSSILAALDSVLSISPQEVAKLNKQEMIEVMEILFDLNRKRELLTSNRRRLTGEARSICNAEIAILNDLEHLMNGEELGQFAQLRSCGQSMDEMAPFDIAIDPADVTLATGAVRLHVVDLLPPADTPMIGSHDPNWDVLLKHIPVEMRGVPPPQHVIQEIQIQQQPAPQIAVQQPATVVFQAAPFAAEQPAAFAPPVQPNGVHQPPPQFIQQAPAQVELPPTSTVEVNAGPAVSNSMESAPPPAPSSQPLPMDFSVPPPFVAVSSSSQETPAGEPLSPRSAFQNTLKQSSLLNSLLPSMSAAPPPTAMLPPQPPIMSGPPPGLAPHLLPGPPPNLGGPPPFAGGSPNRFVAMPPPPMGGNASRPIPLMSIEHPPVHSE
ncbi:hypothetical protein M3Y99_01434700 [Aphelenchoides fujianensis]|nr:hypothetical protein M3Y99_01434700 [Aphelenchoides fujianensis]